MKQSPPRPAALRQAYDGIADKYAGLYEGVGSLPHFYQTRLRLVTAQMEPLPRGTVFDVGSGPGIVGDAVRGLGFTVIAVDQSPGMAREVRRRADGDPGRHAATGLVEALPFGDGTADVVMALGVLEYVAALDTALSECRRVLRPGGTFFVSLLNRQSPYRRLRNLRRRLGLDRDPIPPALFSRAQMERQLAAAGFEVNHVRYFDMELLPPGFADSHPGLAARMAARWERASRSTLMRQLASAFLITATAG